MSCCLSGREPSAAINSAQEKKKKKQIWSHQHLCTHNKIVPPLSPSISSSFNGILSNKTGTNVGKALLNSEAPPESANDDQNPQASIATPMLLSVVAWIYFCNGKEELRLSQFSLKRKKKL